MAIFLSYRREDSGVVTGRLAGDLKDAFGASQVYRDIDNIPPGRDFTSHIQDALKRCDLCVAIIGSEWATPRLFEEDDLLRKELEVVLERRVPLFPLLVDGASLPEAEKVPPSLAALRGIQRLRLDSGSDYELHLGRLVKAIRKERGWWREWRRFLAPTAAMAAVGLSVALWPRAGEGDTPEPILGTSGVGGVATVKGGSAPDGETATAGAAASGGAGSESGGVSGIYRDDYRKGAQTSPPDPGNAVSRERRAHGAACASICSKKGAGSVTALCTLKDGVCTITISHHAQLRMEAERLAADLTASCDRLSIKCEKPSLRPGTN